MRTRQLLDQVAKLESIDVATRLTLLLFLFSTWVVGDQWYYKLPLQLLSVTGLLVPPLHRSRTLWFLVAAAMGLKTIDNWTTQDNHLFLLTWWSLALSLSLGKEEPEKLLATQARLLIGFSFAFAALWKGVLSEDFLDGTYFHFTFLTDGRFSDAAALVGGVSDAMTERNVQALATLENARAQVEAVQLEDTRRLLLVAKVVTYWTLAIESALALAFLAPRLGRHRDALLLAFAWTTYLVANVATFGWTLLTFGAAQCERSSIRALYVASCLLVLVYEHIPLMQTLKRALVP